RAPSDLLDTDGGRLGAVHPLGARARPRHPGARQRRQPMGSRQQGRQGAMSPGVLAQTAVRRDIGVFEWLTDPESWTGPVGILTSLADTVALCAVVVLAAVVLTVPVAALLAH